MTGTTNALAFGNDGVLYMSSLSAGNITPINTSTLAAGAPVVTPSPVSGDMSEVLYNM